MMDTREFTVAEDEGGRLDIYIAERVPEISRSRAQKLIETTNVLVNGLAVKPGHKLQPEDRISLTIPPPEPSEIVPEDIPLDVVYEDDAIIVINKPKGMTVHPAPGSRSGTLVHAILSYADDLSGIGGVERPGIVHRLDKDTSGPSDYQTIQPSYQKNLLQHAL